MLDLNLHRQNLDPQSTTAVQTGFGCTWIPEFNGAAAKPH
jgi:hypothetical protein